MLAKQLFLSSEELAELTGYSQPKKQVEHLIRIGVPYELSAVGKPVVLREAIIQRLSYSATSQRKRKADPNFSYKPKAKN